MNPLPTSVLQEIEHSAVEEIANEHELRERDAMHQFEAWQLRKRVEPELEEIRSCLQKGNIRRALILLNRTLSDIEEPHCHKLTKFMAD